MRADQRILPTGWSLELAENICSQISVGIVVKPAAYYVESGSGIRAFRSANVREGYVDDRDWAHISEEGHRINRKSELKAGDVLIVRTGQPGTACVVPPEYEGSNCIDVIFARPRPHRVLSSYLCEFTNSEFGKKQVLDGQGGLAQQHFNVGAYKQLQIPLPPLAEQAGLMEILSTWNGAVRSVEALLANARTHRAALMQQLLNATKRLPGFSEDWRPVSIADVAEEVSERNTGGTQLPVLSCSKHDGFVESLKYFKKKVYSDDISNYKIVKRGTFAFPSNHVEEGSIGYQDVCDAGIVSPIYCVFRTDETVDDRFLYALFKSDRYRQIFAAATNASVDRRGSLRWKDFRGIRLMLPARPEQAAIGDVLDAASAEIAAYQSQLAALRQEKAALMQQLLTGKRRVKLEPEND